jgi:hypothetical protein
MNRRQAIGAMFTAAAASSALRAGRLDAQEAGARATAVEANMIYLHPATGVDTNSGAKDSPLRTLAEAARRVNRSTGSGPMTVVLSEGIYAVGETTLLKPERRTFSRTERLTVRAEVLPDDPGWHTGRMPTLIHTMPLPKTWNGRPDPLGGAADGMMIETSHVTIQGLKVLGLPGDRAMRFCRRRFNQPQPRGHHREREWSERASLHFPRPEDLGCLLDWRQQRPRDEKLLLRRRLWERSLDGRNQG